MATLTYDLPCPTREYVRTSQRRQVRMGHRSRQVNQRQLRTWRLEYVKHPVQVIDRLVRLWREAGPIEPLNYTPIGESRIEVQFAENSLRHTRNSAVTASATVELEEVR